MSIKNSTIAAAVASAIGATVAGAPSAFATNVSLTQMGSSAVLPVVEQVWHDYCAAGTLAEYRDATAATFAAWSAGGTNYRVYTCTINTTATTTAASIAGYVLTYSQRGTGGSIYGVNPVATSTAEEIMTTTDGCSNLGAEAANAGYNVAVATAFACTSVSTSNTVIPDIGISDVEPAMFYGAGNPNIDTSKSPPINAPLTPAQQNNISGTTFIQQVFGVGVGKNVKGSVTNLTSSQIRSILNGFYTNWSQVGGPNQAINICARTPGSGTQAGALAIFLSNPCAPTGELGLAASATLNASTGALIGCLDTTAETNGTGNGYGIGILSLADGPKSGDDFALVSIDGAAANAQNAAEGSYTYEVESTINTRNIMTYSTAQQNLINALAGVFSDPNSLATVNSGLPAAALNALSANYNPASPYSSASPVEWGTRGGSTCQGYELLFPNP
jgi:ABC-type phosphate transport system substrate-binding protein